MTKERKEGEEGRRGRKGSSIAHIFYAAADPVGIRLYGR